MPCHCKNGQRKYHIPNPSLRQLPMNGNRYEIDVKYCRINNHCRRKNIVYNNFHKPGSRMLFTFFLLQMAIKQRNHNKQTEHINILREIIPLHIKDVYHRRIKPPYSKRQKMSDKESKNQTYKRLHTISCKGKILPLTFTCQQNEKCQYQCKCIRNSKYKVTQINPKKG